MRKTNRRQERNTSKANRNDRRDTRVEQVKPIINTKKLFHPSTIRAKSINQQRYMDAIEANDLVIGIGPPGAGKTLLAVAMAVEAYKAGDVRKIVLVRPHIGLGRTMGFQPGDLLAKMQHYVRPLIDALKEFYTPEQVNKMIEKEEIEVASLEFVRGTTYKHSFVILDEAQNATFDDMKAFLTRLGEGSQYVITGDLSKNVRGILDQSDLHPEEQGALEHFADRFSDLDGVEVVCLTIVDSVRHPLVKAMLERGF